MDPSTAHHHELHTQSLQSLLNPCPQQELKKPKKPQPEQSLSCPRCDSTNTKFCYYNNYSLSQPRYFCKSCRRYWTKGGTLRNIPVGGGCRKNKRPSPPSSTPAGRSNGHLPSLPFAKVQNLSNGGSVGVFDSQSNNFENFYYGFENGGVAGFEQQCGNGVAMKQEVCDGDSNVVLWGFPWQIGDGEGRESWSFNGGFGSSWHGLLNSALM